MCWLLIRVNFSICVEDERSGSVSGLIIDDIRGTDVETDFVTDIRDCEVTPELALTFSESSRGPAKELGSFFSLSWVKGPSS